MNREYFFKKGNKFSTGRPPGAKNQIGFIRERILRVVRRRIMHEKDLETVSTTDLLKFLATIMPKDLSISAGAPTVQYVSNIPRQELEVQPLPIEEKEEVPVEVELSGSIENAAGITAAPSSEMVLRPELHPANDPGPV